MSNKVLTACWELKLSLAQKLVLISLADQANDEGMCWPSVSSLIRRTGMSERSIRYSVKQLENLGFLKIKIRVGHSSFYTITPTGARRAPARNAPASVAPPPAPDAPTPAPRAPPEVQGVHLESSVEPLLNPKEPTASPKIQFKAPPGAFDSVYEALGKKRRKLDNP